jgi:uncharacterized ferredoxin-like protein
MDDLATQLLRADVGVDCPVCGFSVWARMSEMIAQVTILCPCCRVSIRLIDDHGGLATASDTIETLIADLVRDLL